jgi:hypothetical protein
MLTKGVSARVKKHQTAERTGNKTQTAEDRQQTTDGREQKAESRQQTGDKKQSTAGRWYHNRIVHISPPAVGGYGFIPSKGGEGDTGGKQGLLT